jgi:hypothetical protein
MVDTQILNSFGARDSFETGNGKAALYRLTKLEDLGLTKLGQLP